MNKNLFSFFFFLLTYQIGFAQISFGNEKIIEQSEVGLVRVQSGDLDGDGDQDVIAGYTVLKWYENDGSGNFVATHPISQGGGSLQSIYVTDLDGDNKLDIICELNNNQGVSEIVWFKNDGNGNFSSKKTITNQIISGHCVFAADLDGDGDKDVLSASVFDDKIAWYENDGNGNFGLQKIISSTTDGATTVYASDIDGDGDLDIVAGGAYDGTISWYQNIDGKGTFGSKKIISYADQLQFAYTADLDGDGDQDVYFAGLTGTIAWSKNDGNGNFGTRLTIGYGSKPTDIFAQDFDNDGDLDIVSVADNGTLSWFENNGFGQFGEQIIISNTNNRSVHSADLNGDGKSDILTASFYEKRVSWYENMGYLGINDIKTQLFSVYPNPAKDFLTIDSNETIKDVEIINSAGHKLLSVPHPHTINISNLINGIYFIKIQDNKGNLEVKKIIKK